MVLMITAAGAILGLSAIQITFSIYRENENDKLIKNIERYDKGRKA